MNIVVWFLGGLVAIGAGIAIYERRRKATLLKHDLNQLGPQTEADRELERSSSAIWDRIIYDNKM